jgi:hypothetical protein
VAKARWGLGQAIIHDTLYKGLFIPITTYAAAGWCYLLKGKTKKMLIRSQRMALLQVTKAYRTSSTEALQVIAGVMPIDLLIEVRAWLHRKKRGHKEESSKKVIIQEAIQKRQQRWLTTQKGRTNFEYFYSTKERLVNRSIKPDHYRTQFISGHSDFNSKLKTFRLSKVDTCDCGMEERSTYWKTVNFSMKNDRNCRMSYRIWNWTGRKKSESSSPNMYIPTFDSSQEVFCRQRNRRGEQYYKEWGAHYNREDCICCTAPLW